MLEQQVHDAAASIIDPETGKHPKFLSAAAAQPS
jgi:hypothetical protein